MNPGPAVPRALGKTNQVLAARPAWYVFRVAPAGCANWRGAGSCPHTWAWSQASSQRWHALPTRCVASGAPGSRSHSLSPLTCASCDVFCGPQSLLPQICRVSSKELNDTIFHVKYMAPLLSCHPLHLVFGEKPEEY